MKKFLTFFADLAVSSIPPIAVLIIHIGRVIFFPTFYEGDMIMHFSGGAAIAWMAMMLWNRWTKHGWIPKENPLWLRDIAVWGSVALAGVFWEFMETWSDLAAGTRMQFSVLETMGDLFLDLSGGLLFIGIFRLFRVLSKKPIAKS